MSALTLRQIEVIRAVMIAGSIAGAARHLNTTGPGISRMIKHAEESLGLRLFERKSGAFLPAPEARRVFDQINEVFGKMDGLEAALSDLKSGKSGLLAFGSVPSVAQFMVARSCVNLRKRFPELRIDLNILKLEEAVDYLLLDRGELVAMSYDYEHASLVSTEIGRGKLIAVVPDEHPLASRKSLSITELAREPLIGVPPEDPYGAVMAKPFRDAGLDYVLSIRARFAQTVVSLVRHGLGVAVIDEFSVAGVYMPGLTRIPLEEHAEITIYTLTRKNQPLSSYAETAQDMLQKELKKAVASRPWEGSGH
ncbi:LysR family transcriptional regulator [Paracoccaceae bacterium GXU_MW_L88]